MTAAAPKAKKARKPSHPTTGDMIKAALSTSKRGKGMSKSAVVKYILENNTSVDQKNLGKRVYRYIKSELGSGITQVKGKGLSGSFKLAPSVVKVKVKKASVSKKPVVKKVTKTGKSTTAKTKKSTASKSKVKRKPVVVSAASKMKKAAVNNTKKKVIKKKSKVTKK
ncbi:hypothetical protein A3Q56_03561 [Intoshia linei]|uniref:H15 domain-containing protein n=1 Tax=Intoshia linei TaxID=1819745 RepID=A0A177B336_9BILA|nr:hypothetical protein A3Q56_03561 [Intoshia linei]